MDDGQRASDQAGGDSVGAACGPPLFCVSKKKGEKRPETLQKEKKPIGRPTIHPSFPRGLETKKIRQNHPETIQKKRRNAMPRMSRKRREEWDFFLNRRDRITCNDLCRNCRHGCKRASRRRSWPAGSTGARGTKHGGNTHHGHAPEQRQHNCSMLERPNGLCQKPRQERTMSLLFL